MNRSGPVPVASLRLFVANSLKADPLKYVAWGVLVDQESPAETVAAYADALREPRSAYGGQLELHIMQDHFGFRYYAFDLPEGLVRFRYGSAEQEYDDYGSPPDPSVPLPSRPL